MTCRTDRAFRPFQGVQRERLAHGLWYKEVKAGVGIDTRRNARFQKP